MNFELKNRVAIIGGSSKGLGKACAFALAREGAHVVICARNQETLFKTAEAIRKETSANVFPIPSDLSKKEEIENLVDKTIKEFGRIDILINNSGGPPAGSFFDFSEEQWMSAYESILLYVVRMVQRVVPQMKKNKWGRIVNITSLLVKEPSENLILSGVFRSGVVSLAKALSTALIKDNITVNNICPGAFKTERALALGADLSSGNYQDPKELGDFVAFLCSEKAKGISGTTIPIDGALSQSLF